MPSTENDMQARNDQLGAALRSIAPSVVEDFERFKQVVDARGLLESNGWAEVEPDVWSPAPHLGWAIDLRRCSPADLRALAILAEETKSDEESDS